MKYAKRRDKVEPEIVRALQQAGCSVTRLNEAGCPDLLVGRNGRTYLLEVKDPKRDRYDQDNARVGLDTELTDAQRAWWLGWKGEPAKVVRTVGEALGVVERSEGEHG